MNSTDIKLYEVDCQNFKINPQFSSYKKWVKCYLGPATAELHGIEKPFHYAIKDENRNAILPSKTLKIKNKTFFLAVKGCGAYEDMFSGKRLSSSGITQACRDLAYISKVKNLSTGMGFMMAESWMGESPYGSQGFINGFDELKFSVIAEEDSINGAYICPVIGVVKIPPEIENVARKFFWFRTYKDHFYQVIRLMPSNVRLYFESSRLVANPHSFLSIFEIDNEELMESFELNFIKSGIALLSLYTRSAKIEGNNVKGIIYQDVWLDKDCVVAPDGTIHFADLEGLIWKTVPKDKYPETQRKEWEKLVFEFLFALVKLDEIRQKLKGKRINWKHQREELSILIQMALNQDVFAHTENNAKNLNVVLDGTNLSPIEIPILEMVN